MRNSCENCKCSKYGDYLFSGGVLGKLRLKCYFLGDEIQDVQFGSILSSPVPSINNLVIRVTIFITAY